MQVFVLFAFRVEELLIFDCYFLTVFEFQGKMMSNFDIWNVIVGQGSHHLNGTNMSDIDVLTKNCVMDYDTIACLRGTLFCFLSTVTGLLCAGRIINLHLNGHPNYYQYIVFYLALVECFMG